MTDAASADGATQMYAHAVTLPDRHNRLVRWLRDEAGVTEPRRIVRDEPSGILVSKFDEGFAARLLAAVEALRDVFDSGTVFKAYAAQGAVTPTLPRIDCWAEAIRGLLNDAVAASRIDAEERAQIEAGVDSVAVVLSTVLWTGPSFVSEYSPYPGEIAAYHDAVERMNADNSLFTRSYGVFEGVPVMNHCPGARVARRLLAEAWTICTGLPEPE